MTWDDVRRLSLAGVTFGPHSVTHPLLSRVNAEQSQREIAESWRRVRAEAGVGAVPIFCYPNGEAADYGRREEEFVAESGMRAAVSTSPGYASPRHLSAAAPALRYGLPRFAYTDDRTAFIQCAGGMERAKMAFRRALRPNPV